LKAGYLSNRESYEYVKRNMDYARIYGELTGQWLKKVNNKLRLNLWAKGGYTRNIDHKIVMPYANMKESIKEYVNHSYLYKKASYASVQTGVRTDYQAEKWTVGIFGQVATAWQFCSEGEREANLQVALGIIF